MLTATAMRKLFIRIECVRCGTRFHFTDRPPASRSPRCPGCGTLSLGPQEMLLNPGVEGRTPLEQRRITRIGDVT